MRIACLLFFLPGAALAGDLVVRERTTIEGPQPKSFEVTQYYGERKVVMDGPRQRTIVDLDAKTMTMVDKAAKGYSVATFDGARRQGEMLKEKFAQLPQEKQEEQLQSDVKVTAEPTGKSEKIAGYDAKEYLVVAGPIRGSVWVTDALAAPSGKREWEKVAASMRGISRLNNRFDDAVNELKGVTLRKVVTKPGKDTPTREVTEALSVSREAPPPDVVVVPDGFMKYALPGMGG